VSDSRRKTYPTPSLNVERRKLTVRQAGKRKRDLSDKIMSLYHNFCAVFESWGLPLSLQIEAIG